MHCSEEGPINLASDEHRYDDVLQHMYNAFVDMESTLCQDRLQARTA